MKVKMMLTKDRIVMIVFVIARQRRELETGG